MAAHKFWRAKFTVSSGDALDLSELQLYTGAVRVDTAATLTGTVPTSGAVAALKDGLATAGPYWSSGASAVVLSWAFSTAVEVDGVVLGSMATAVRYPTTVFFMGSDTAGGTDRVTLKGLGTTKFMANALSALIGLQGPRILPRPVVTAKDYGPDGGRGLITDTVKTKATPTNTPTLARVRLVRDIDGKVVRETWSDPVTGLYTFNYFSEQFTYMVIAIHPTGLYRAVIADRLTPGLMP